MLEIAAHPALLEGESPSRSPAGEVLAFYLSSWWLPRLGVERAFHLAMAGWVVRLGGYVVGGGRGWAQGGVGRGGEGVGRGG